MFFRSCHTSPGLMLWLLGGIVFLSCRVAASDEKAAAQARSVAIMQAFETGRNGVPEAGAQNSLKVMRFGRTWLFRGYSNDKIMVEELVCFLCTDKEAQTRARSLGAAVGAKNRGAKPAVVSAPELSPGEEILIDDIPLAPATVPAPIEPGTHQVLMHKKDTVYKGDMRLNPGTDMELFAKIETAPMHQVISTKTGVLLGGLGATAMVIGGVFLWNDGRCAIFDSQGDCSQQHDLLTAGWSLLAMGAVTEGLAIWLAWPRRGGGAGAGL